jgi:ribonuclease Y
MGTGIAIGVIAAVVGLVLGLAAGYYTSELRRKRLLEDAEHQAKRLVAEAETTVKEQMVQARDEALRLRDEAEKESREQQRELRKDESRLQKLRASLDERLEQLEQRERRLNQRQSLLDKRTSQLEKLEKERLVELERVANMSQEDARALLLETVEQDSRQDMARVIRQVEAEAQEEADRRARKIVTTAIQRIASDQVSEIAISTVPLPSDDMKGRIIGRQGRNIRALEKATGVDLVVDDTPEAVLLSCFDPIRIEKVVANAQDEVNQIVREAGEQAALEVGVPGLHPEILKLLGRLRFRTSYGQNQLNHAVETAHLAGIMAAELGARVQVAKAGALLHDLGKAVDHEVEGPHALIGADLARRYGISPEIVNCIASHHGETERESLESIIVEAADAISGARPGARRESMETYIKRIKALEEVANSFDGVAETYAIQAGREIRIIVKPDQIDDLAAIQLSKDVAKAVEDNLQYPGQIKINVIRETRAVDFAK